MEDEKRTKEIGYKLQFIWHSEPESDESEIYPPGRRKYRRVKKALYLPVVEVKPRLTVESLFVTGVEKLTLSSTTQEALGCLVGETVTSEYPWFCVSKESIENSIYSNPLSEFIEISEAVEKFPNSEFLMVYIPKEDTEEQEFFICLTVEAEEKVNSIIEQMLVQREEFIQNIRLKTSRPWRSLGSDCDILGIMNINNRPLLEVEVGTAYPLKDVPTHFRLRMAEDVRDGYVEILSHRHTFKNTERRRIDISAQSTPILNPVSSQSCLPYPKNVSTQYDYTYKQPEVNQEWLKMFKYYTERKGADLYDSINMNSYFNFHSNDYKDLIKDKQARTKPAIMTEFTTVYNHTLEKHKVLAAICWHPMWSGVIATAYSSYARNSDKKFIPQFDETSSSMFNVTPVLLWTFANPLEPLMFLESPREITTLSFCPYNENLLLGGCHSGQVIMWDLTNCLQRAEEDIILTPAQENHRKRLQCLIRWMKNTYDQKVVRPTVLSNIKFSHANAIMDISWVSPHNEISSAGKVVTIPELQSRNSLQFTTVSLDGSILVWDLGGATASHGTTSISRVGRLKELPERLRSNISPFKYLNRILKPKFIANILNPTTLQPLPTAIVGRQNPPVSYVQKKITSHTTVRDYYNPVLHRSSNIQENSYFLGTTTGDVFKASWQGFDFKSSEFITTELCEISNLVKFHDGVVVSLDVCTQRNDLILSVGGKIFALWLLDYPSKPIIWKKSKDTYTNGTWTYRQSVIVLSRSDGCLEVWNFSIRSNICQFITDLSRGPIVGVYVHNLPLKQEVVAISDYKQAVRLYYVDRNIKADYTDEDAQFHNIIKREQEKKIILDKWNKAWNHKYASLVEFKQRKLLEVRKRKIEGRTGLTGTEQEPSTEVTETKDSKPSWKKKELDRMNASLLNKAGIDLEVIKEQQKPLIRIENELKEKQRKLKLHSRQAENIFIETLQAAFPDIVQKEEIRALDPYAGGDYIYKVDSFIDESKDIEIIYRQFVAKNQYKYEFNWFNLLQNGKKRRKLLDVWKERSIHKDRLIRERSAPKPKPVKPAYLLDSVFVLDDYKTVDMEVGTTIKNASEIKVGLEKESEDKEKEPENELKREPDEQPYNEPEEENERDKEEPENFGVETEIEME